MNAVMHPEGLPQLKIRPEHLDRAAIVYVRQSTRVQVLEHTESTRLQYELAGRAVALGWARSQVIVIDDDLGRPGASAADRDGIRSSWSREVYLGQVGIVLGLEMLPAGPDRAGLASAAGAVLADRDADLRRTTASMTRRSSTTGCCWGYPPLPDRRL